MSGTILSLLPPILTIALALITKQVYFSLGIGILLGAAMFTGFSVLGTIDTTFAVMSDKIGGNVNILVFLVLLGIMVVAIQRSGASKAYGEYAAGHISGRRPALFMTMLLGLLIFLDDYFNCLTVGTVMRPVTDRFKITRAKLAYIIDATAAPVCIIAPVSSWAAAVTSSLPKDSGIDGFALFLNTIPLNLYALFTIAFMIFLIICDKDFSRMAEYERQVASGLKKDGTDSADEKEEKTGNGTIKDLVIPLIVLIAACIFGMLHTGGIAEGKSVAEAFADCDAARGLVIGGFTGLAFTFFFYIPRKVMDFKSFCDCIPEGFIQMTGAILILCLAWSLSGICGEEYLNIGGYVGEVVRANAGVARILPPLFFLTAIGLAFATGTSWGTFAILIPIVIAAAGSDAALMTMTVAAVLAGAVGGDHVSPISDTTILASAGARCEHIDHVSTQIPYVLVVSACCFLGYLVMGLSGSGAAGVGFGSAALLAVMVFIAKFIMK